MQKFSKLILCAGLSAIAMAGLAGCGGGSSNDASTPANGVTAEQQSQSSKAYPGASAPKTGG